MTTQSNEQQAYIDNTEKALDILKKWFEEDKENRGFIIIKSKRKEKVDDAYYFDGNCAIYGNRDILIAGVEKAISNANANGILLDIFTRAIEILLIRKKEREQN